jgi:hypothetical protein
MIYEGCAKPFLNKNEPLAEKPLPSKQGLGGKPHNRFANWGCAAAPSPKRISSGNIVTGDSVAPVIRNMDAASSGRAITIWNPPVIVVRFNHT